MKWVCTFFHLKGIILELRIAPFIHACKEGEPCIPITRSSCSNKSKTSYVDDILCCVSRNPTCVGSVAISSSTTIAIPLKLGSRNRNLPHLPCCFSQCSRLHPEPSLQRSAFPPSWRARPYIGPVYADLAYQEIQTPAYRVRQGWSQLGPQLPAHPPAYWFEVVVFKSIELNGVSLCLWITVIPLKSVHPVHYKHGVYGVCS
jgi:hypothetical protein